MRAHEPRILMTGLTFGESPRWHDGRFWFSNWVAQEIVAVDLAGRSEVILRTPVRGISLLHRLAAGWTPAHRLGERPAPPAPGA